MARLDYGKVIFEKISVCGIECEFSDMRIDKKLFQGANISMRLPEMMKAAANRLGSSQGSWSISLVH